MTPKINEAGFATTLRASWKLTPTGSDVKDAKPSHTYWKNDFVRIILSLSPLSSLLFTSPHDGAPQPPTWRAPTQANPLPPLLPISPADRYAAPRHGPTCRRPGHGARAGGGLPQGRRRREGPREREAAGPGHAARLRAIGDLCQAPRRDEAPLSRLVSSFGYVARRSFFWCFASFCGGCRSSLARRGTLGADVQ